MSLWVNGKSCGSMLQHILHKSLLALSSHEMQRHDHQASWSVIYRNPPSVVLSGAVYLEFDYILADLFDNPSYIVTLVDIW